MVTLIVTGSVSAVTAAVESACAQCIKKPCASAVIANPHPETVRLAELSAKRLEKQAQAKEQAKAAKKPAKKAEVKAEENRQITISDVTESVIPNETDN